jgi:ATP-binding cassette subfamily B protein
MEKHTKPNIFAVLKPYRWFVAALVVCALVQNATNLVIPKIVSHTIDSFTSGNIILWNIILFFVVAIVLIVVFISIQNVLQVIVSERVAYELRAKIADKISRQSFQFVLGQSSAKLLTNLTSDVDGVKSFVSQVVPILASSLFLIIGATILLFTIDWRLALAVMAIIPAVGITFGVVFARVGGLFKKSQEIIDRLNRVINESIVGAALIRVVNSQAIEYEKFIEANTRAKTLGVSILKAFASMIPTIMAVSNAALVVVLVLGGHFVIAGSMTVGDLAAFNGYIAILIFPIMMLGFVGNMMARATASYGRITQVLESPEAPDGGSFAKELTGDIALHNVVLAFGEQKVLRDVSLSVRASTKTAIVGPTAAGKTQLIYVLTGLIPPTAGLVSYDGTDLSLLNRESFHKQIGLVFQDSIMFNVSLRENISFGGQSKEEDIVRAIETAELRGLVAELPEGLETLVSERGTSLSGGQKQRIMLARALAQNPKILFLDDFTARVDVATEEKIIRNLERNYPHLTLVSVTQKITSAKEYDQVILLMEGEVLASGTHEELLEKSPEYVQIWNSQQSTNAYELHT